jgi:cellulose synthase/poly-beta-1,6-N-acetylglucosamine synthase-like glycosyltransferase
MISTLNPVSIIVPIKNRCNLLPNLIKNLSNLDYPEFEIIIVDDCSTDNTKKLLKHYPIKSIILEKSVGSAQARNIGIKEAKNDIVALTDSDCFVSKNWLKNLVPYLNNYDVVGGRVIFCDDTEKKINPFNTKNETVLTKESSINFLNTSNMLFKKEIFKLSGGFLDYRIEDLEFSWRLLTRGFKLIYSPKGLVIHHGNRTPLQNIKKYLQYGKSYSKIAFIHKMSFSYKTEQILDKNAIIEFLKLISLPFLFLFASILFSSIIINVLLNLSVNIFTIFLCIFFAFRLFRRIDIIFKIYKFTIIFGIVNYSLIYLLKKKYNLNKKRVQKL